MGTLIGYYNFLIKKVSFIHSSILSLDRKKYLNYISDFKYITVPWKSTWQRLGLTGIPMEEIRFGRRNSSLVFCPRAIVGK